MEPLGPTPRTKLSRRPQRGSHDRALVYAILDEGLVCHVGVALGGQPYVLPMSYGRLGDQLYLHGAPGSRMLGALRSGAQACVTVSVVDGLVLGRTASKHSVNYRSVVLFGVAREVVSPGEKRDGLAAILEHFVPGRAAEVGGPTEADLNGTLVLAMAIAEASAKARTGPPADVEEEDGCWAGVIPLRIVTGAPEAHPRLAPSVPLDPSVVRRARS
ncbi:MAG: pyridoxamine 5'-phosphate oxidase family protein [Deltaproteobacteria bacterium]|nr:pyridoxamine 5'-phosphate oxidase family protein [Deltaproteobacteria bacterium]